MAVLMPRMEIAALAISVGRSVEEAAHEAQVTPRTVVRWNTLAEFTNRIQELRSNMTERVLSKLTAGSVEASDVLRALLGSATEKVVLQAAVKMIELSARIKEMCELDARLSALERANQASPMPPPEPQPSSDPPEQEEPPVEPDIVDPPETP